jgi:hypothetical protein
MMTFLLPTMKRPQPPSLDDPDAVDSSWCPVCSTMDSRRADFPTELMPVEGGRKKNVECKRPFGAVEMDDSSRGSARGPLRFSAFEGQVVLVDDSTHGSARGSLEFSAFQFSG